MKIENKELYDFLKKWECEAYYSNLISIGITDAKSFSELCSADLLKAKIWDRSYKSLILSLAARIRESKTNTFYYGTKAATESPRIEDKKNGNRMDVLDTDGVFARVNEIIKSAEKFIILISPYINLNTEQALLLKEACDRGVSIDLVYREDEPDSKNSNNKSLDILKKLKRINIIECPRLHAKIYANESDLVISSRNLYTAQEGCAVEIGVSFSSDTSQYGELLKSAKRIIAIRDVVVNKKAAQIENEDTNGFCIRCGVSIDYNPSKPMCYDCYSVWSQWEDPNYKENYCHRCGDSATPFISFSFANPMHSRCSYRPKRWW